MREGFFNALEGLIGTSHAALVGDLQAAYRDIRASQGRGKAALWLGGQLLATIPRVLLFNLLWERFMLKNYLVIAVRQMRRHWSFSLINVMGLALSLAVCLLILSLLHDQRGFDSFHENGDRIARMTSTVVEPFGTFRMATSAGPLGPELVRQSPDVEAVIRLRRTGGHLRRADGLRAGFAGLYAPPGFFDFFGFELQEGKEKSALDEPLEVVLSPEFAETMFGHVPAVGQELEWEGVGPVTISGVLAPASGKTHLRADVLLSFASIESFIAGGSAIPLHEWAVNSSFYNYLLLRPGASARDVEALANRLAQANRADASRPVATYRLQMLSSVNMGADLSNQIADVMSRELAIALSILALVLVLTAVFNYINLTVSRAVRRAREIGIRKVVGAHRRQLMQQLVTEAVVTSLAALIAASGMLAWLMPQFNALTAVNESGDVMQVSGIDGGLLLQFVIFALTVGVLAGLLPAWRMSRMTPARTLKGITGAPGRQRLGFRKVLVVGQFVVSIVAITLTVVLFRQTEFAVKADLGFDHEQLVHVELQGLEFATVRDELLRVPGVTIVSATSAPPSVGSRTTTDIKTAEMEDPMLIERYSGDDGFLEQYRIGLLAGRNLSADYPSDPMGSVLLTETAVRKLNLGTPEEAVGAQIDFDMAIRGEDPVTVVGVIEDFYTDGVDGGHVAVSVVSRPNHFRFAAVRVDGNPAVAMERLEEAWDRLAPRTEMQARFFDEQIQVAYAGMRDGIRVLGLFAFLIVAIASLGLLGMATYSAETRMREVGIRKVVGAEAGHLVALLSREYLVLVGIATLVAVPAAYTIGSAVLSRSAEHVSLGPLTLMAGVLPVVLLAVLTVGSQTFRAAMTNPVEVLRND